MDKKLVIDMDNNKKFADKSIDNSTEIKGLLHNEYESEKIFDSEIKKFFSENKRNKDDKVTILMKNILSSLNNKKIEKINNYNKGIIGPFLAGSYKIFPDLCFFKYTRGIDIIYKYKNIIISDELIDFTIKELIINYLGLNIVKYNQKEKNENMDIKYEVKSFKKSFGNEFIIKFNFLFFNFENDFSGKILDNLILNEKKFLFENEEQNFKNICIFMRIWRRNNNLFYLIPEIIDNIVRKNYEKNRTMPLVILNVFFDIFNIKEDTDQGREIKPKVISDIIFHNIFNDENKLNDLKDKILSTVMDIDNKNFNNILKM